MNSTKKIVKCSHTKRKRYVKQLLDGLRIEGIAPDVSDRLLLQAYIDDTITRNDLFAHTRQFATSSDYRRWQCNREAVKTDCNKRTMLADQLFLAEMRELIRRKDYK